MSFHRGSLYAPDKRFFICETVEQRDALLARGWTNAPEYPAGEAEWLKHFPEVDPPKPERVVGADTDGDGVIDKVFKKKPGRPKKD